MPKASAPNAPWVEVWLSPHTTVMPGWVRPELRADHVDDPPQRAVHVRAGGRPNFRQFSVIWAMVAGAEASTTGSGAAGGARGGGHDVVDGAQGAVRAAHRQPAARAASAKARREVSSWRRWRSM